MWACLQKLRRAMVPTGRNQLSNDVEIDETYVEGVQAGVDGTDTGKQSLGGNGGTERRQRHRADSLAPHPRRHCRTERVDKDWTLQ